MMFLAYFGMAIVTLILVALVKGYFTTENLEPLDVLFSLFWPLYLVYFALWGVACILFTVTEYVFWKARNLRRRKEKREKQRQA